MTAKATRPNPFTRWALCAGLAALAIALAHLGDRFALTNLHIPSAHNEDWGRMLRILGYVPTWLIIAIAFALIDGAKPRACFTVPLRDRWSRAATLLLSAILAGLLAELTKALVRRERPDLETLAYTFRPYWQDPWTTSGLGMPSGHTAVAFGAATMLCRLHPSAWPLWLAIAAGCGATRIFAQAHYLSDVVTGALVGALASTIIWSLHLRVLARSGVHR